MAYQNNFSKKNILGERDVLVSDLLDPTSTFIKDIFMKKKKQWGKLTEEASALYVEEVMKFYVNCEPFNFNDHSITFSISCLLLSLKSYMSYLES